MRSFEKQMLLAIESKHTALIALAAMKLRDLPPQEYAMAQAVKHGGLDTRSPFFPWVMKQIKQGHFYTDDWMYARYLKPLEDVHEKKGGPTEYENAIWTMKYHGNPHQWFHTKEDLEHPSSPEDIISDLEDFLPHLRTYHRIASKDPNYNLNAMNPKGVINALKQVRRERAKNYGKVVHTLPNGWTVRKIKNGEEARWEGDTMANCIGDYADRVDSGRAHLFSLRDEKNKPKVSVELSPIDPATGRSQDPWGHGQTLKASKQWELGQVYEKANGEVRGPYKAMLKHWFDAMKQKGHALRGFETHPIEHVKNINDGPFYDDYGLEAKPSISYTPFFESMIKPGGRAYRYDPELIQQGWDYLTKQEEAGDPGYYLHNFLQPHVQNLENVSQAVGKKDWNQLRENPYVQAIAHLQRLQVGNPELQPTYASTDVHFEPESIQAHEHMNPYGEPCTCPWGRHR